MITLMFQCPRIIVLSSNVTNSGYQQLLLLSSACTTIKRIFHNNCDQFEEDYQNLGVSASVDAAGARDAFLRLSKQYHPDSGNQLANETNFKRIETSYRRLLKKFSDERHNHTVADGEYGLYYNQKRKQRDQPPPPDEDNRTGFYTLKPKAPQHRQYLSYEGIGAGTPAQREKQFTKYKAMRATENVIDYKVQQLQEGHPETGLISQERIAAKNIRTKYGIERVVEDLIQESMARGDFDNLPNAGKPLHYDNHNPFVDAATHKLNQVLINSGYVPEWVQLERDLRDDKHSIRTCLTEERMALGPLPLLPQEQALWDKKLDSLTNHLYKLNKKIDKYNLVVPVLSKQMVHFPLQQMADKILTQGIHKHHPDAALCNGGKKTADAVAIDDHKNYSLKDLFNVFKL